MKLTNFTNLKFTSQRLATHDGAIGRWLGILTIAVFFIAFFLVSTKLSSMVSAPDLLKTRFLLAGCFGVLALWFAGMLKDKKLLEININFIWLALVVMIIWGGITLFWAFHKNLGSIALIRWVQTAMMGFLFINFLTKVDRAIIVLKLLVIVGFILSIIGILQFFQLFDFILQAISPASTFGNRNMAMDALIMVMPFSFIFFVMSKNILERLLMGVIFMTYLVYTAFTYNRAGFFGLAVEMMIGAGVLIYFYIKKKPLIDKQQLVMLSCFLLLALAISIVGYEMMKLDFMSRYLQVDEFISGEKAGRTVHERMKIFYNTLMMIKDNFFFGLGFGNWTVYFPYYSGNNILMPKLMASDPNSNVLYKQTHNEYLQIFAETGVIGFLLMVVFAGLILWGIARILKDRTNKHWLLAFGLLLAFAGESIALGASFPLRVAMAFNIIILYASILSLLLTSTEKRDKKESKEKIEKIEKKLPLALSSFTITISKPIALVSLVLTLVVGAFTIKTHNDWVLGHQYRNHSTAFLKANRLDLAEGYLVKSLEYNPADADDTLYILGNVYKAQGKFHQTISTFNRAFTTSLPYHPYMYNHMATAYQAVGDTLGAINVMREAIRLMPLQDGYYRNLAALYASIGQIDRAILLYERALELNPDIYGKKKIVSIVRRYRLAHPNPFNFILDPVYSHILATPLAKDSTSIEVNNP